jgi:hypothetical protein
MVVYKEGDKYGPVIKKDEIVNPTDDGTGVFIPPATLPGYYNRLAVSATVPYEFYGVDAVTIEAYYEKELVNIPITTVNDLPGTDLSSNGTTMDYQRKGEVVTVTAPVISGYVVVNGSPRLVVADDSVPVEFRYRATATESVLVNVYSGNALGVNLMSYTIPATSGTPVTIDPATISISGYSLNSGHIDQRLSVVSGNGDDIRVIMNDVRKTVTVRSSISGGNATLDSVEKVPSGTPKTIFPAYREGYVATQYSLDGVTKTDIPALFAGYSVNPVTDNFYITFYYETVETVVNENYVSLTISGVTGAVTHYSYVKRVPKSSTQITLLDGVDVFDVPGYKLVPSQLHGVTPDIDRDVTFDYVSAATTVTIKMVESGNPANEVAPPFNVPATVGAVFTYNAPSVNGYKLTSASSIGEVASVAAYGASFIEFEYAAITGALTIVAKEDGPDGRVILVYEIPSPLTGVNDYDVPDLSTDYYTAKATTVEIDYDGTGFASVDAYYTKDLVTVPVSANNLSDSAALTSLVTSLLNQRKGEAVTVNVPGVSEAGYYPVGDYALSALATGAGVTFDYKGVGADEVAVKAVADGSGELLHSYLLSGAPSSNVFADPPEILGWTVISADDAQKGATVGTHKELVFAYTKDIVTVTINAEDNHGAIIASPVQVEIARGGDYTAIAAHIPGYVIYGINTSKSFSSLVQDASVTFTYRAVDAAATIQIDYVDSSDKTTVIKSQSLTGLYVGMTFTATDIVPESFNFGGRRYAIDTNETVYPIILLATNQVDVFYNDVGPEVVAGGGGGGGGSSYTTATLVIKGLDKATGDVIYNQSVTTVVDRKETITAPSIEGYKLSAGVSATQEITIKADTNTVIFTYDKAGSEPDERPDGGVSDKIKETLETDEHVKYLSGYTDGTVRPYNTIPRAEVATIFFRLVKDPNKNDAIASAFTDVADDAWYAQAVSYLAKQGIITGYEDGTFKPGRSITRAEFAVIASRFDDIQQGISNAFKDVGTTHWAYTEILSAYTKGWISGYPGNVFLPGNAITRAEVVKIVNKMIGRRLTAENVPTELQTLFSDLNRSHWAFADVIEASVSHEYERDVNGNETWSEYTK